MMIGSRCGHENVNDCIMPIKTVVNRRRRTNNRTKRAKWVNNAHPSTRSSWFGLQRGPSTVLTDIGSPTARVSASAATLATSLSYLRYPYHMVRCHAVAEAILGGGLGAAMPKSIHHKASFAGWNSIISYHDHDYYTTNFSIKTISTSIRTYTTPKTHHNAHSFLHEHTGSSTTALARVGREPHQHIWRGGFKVAVGKHNVRTLAAQFEAH